MPPGQDSALFERRLADGRWLGHAENHVPVVAVAPDGGSLNNAIGVVMAESCDLRAPDRVVAAVLAQPSGSRPEMRDLFYDNNIKGWAPS